MGCANLRYLRYGRFFVLLATHGKHRFFEEEAANVRDIRRVPLKFAGYSIRYRAGQGGLNVGVKSGAHSRVEIDRPRYLELKAYLAELAVRRSAESLALEFYRPAV